MKMAPILNTQIHTKLCPFYVARKIKLQKRKNSNENYMLKLIIMKINFTFFLSFFTKKRKKNSFFAPQICFALTTLQPSPSRQKSDHNQSPFIRFFTGNQQKKLVPF